MAGDIVTGPFAGSYCSQKEQTMGCYQGPCVEQMRWTLASAGHQCKSRQVAPAVLYTARRACARSMDRGVTRKGACQAPTQFSEHRMGTCVCLKRSQMRTSTPNNAVCTTAPDMLCTSPQGLHTPARHPVQCALTPPVCWCCSQVRAVYPVALNGRTCGQSFQTPATADELKGSVNKAEQGV